MTDIWSILGIPPTQDEALIKRAYASQSKNCHPEEDPQGFMRLREAYRAALAQVQGGCGADQAPPSQTICQAEQAEQVPACEPAKPEETPSAQEVTFSFSQPASGPDNPLWQSEAFQRFLKLYKKENQKNWKVWMEYLVSPAFLTVSHEEDFCALLLEQVEAQLESIKPGPAFIKGLYIAYCLEEIHQSGSDPRRFQQQGGPPCPQPLAQLMALLPACPRFSGDDLAMFTSFTEYYHLMYLEDQGGWGDEGLHVLRKVLDRYHMAYLHEKVPTPSFADPKAADYARHPLGLRLLTHFFSTAALPAEAYQITWENLDLKSATMGRASVFYGPLRTICLERCPQLDGQERERFVDLKTAFIAFTQAPESPEAVDAFFARPDLSRALLNRTFIEGDVLNHWISPVHGAGFLEKLRDFYAQNPQAPFSARVQELCTQARLEQVVRARNQEDEEMESDPIQIGLTNRPFLRYWLNTAFPRFGRLNQEIWNRLPPSPAWRSRLFAPLQQEGAPVSPIPVQWENLSIQVHLHQFYLAYSTQDEELAAPCIPFQQLVSLGEPGLWLLPLALVRPGEEDKVAQELVTLLAETALPSEDIIPIANALTEGLYQWNVDGDVQSALIFRETDDTLYGAEIAMDYSSTSFDGAESPSTEEAPPSRLTVQLFRVEKGRPLYLPDLYGPFPQWDDALAEANRLVTQLVTPPPLRYAPPGEHHARRLPDCIHYHPHLAPEECWTPPAPLLNRLYSTLDFWAELHKLAKHSEEQVDAMGQRWTNWTQAQGRMEPLAQQLKTLLEALPSDVLPPHLTLESLTGPASPAHRLDQLQAALDATEGLSQLPRLQALLDAPGWAEQPPAQPPKQVSLFSGLTAFLKSLFRPRQPERPDPAAQPEELRTAFLNQAVPLLEGLLHQVEELRAIYLDGVDHLLYGFAAGELDRLELAFQPSSWELSPREDAYSPMHSLVFLRQNEKLSCLYFNDAQDMFYALCRQEDRPGTHAELFINISQDKPLPEPCLFHSMFPLQCHLQDILDVLMVHNHKDSTPSSAGPYYWLAAWGGVYVGDRRAKYNLAKRELGAFPLERAAAPIEAGVSLPAFLSFGDELKETPPLEMARVDGAGQPLPPVSIHKNNRTQFRQAMEQFFAGELSQLRLTWAVSPLAYKDVFAPSYYQEHLERLGEETPFCHILLSRDGEKMLLLVLEDFTRHGVYCVADQRTYLDVEGKKYPKDTFANKTIPAYLIHTDPLALRSHLDLLLDRMSCPYSVTTRFAAYADEKPVRPRSYEEIREEALKS